MLLVVGGAPTKSATPCSSCEEVANGSGRDCLIPDASKGFVMVQIQMHCVSHRNDAGVSSLGRVPCLS